MTVGVRKVLVGIHAVEMQITTLDRADAVLHAHDLVQQLTAGWLPKQPGVRFDPTRQSQGGRSRSVKHGRDVGMAGPESKR